MSKYFLYLDESKDFKNQIIYIWWFCSLLSIQRFENIYGPIVDRYSEIELKSTQSYDREFFETLNIGKQVSYFEYSQKLYAKSDKDYLSWLLIYIESFLLHRSLWKITELHIYADFNRLAPDMRSLEKTFSRKLTHTFDMPITIEFKNSRNYRSIQFADLIVGTYRRSLK